MADVLEIVTMSGVTVLCSVYLINYLIENRDHEKSTAEEHNLKRVRDDWEKYIERDNADYKRMSDSLELASKKLDEYQSFENFNGSHFEADFPETQGTGLHWLGSGLHWVEGEYNLGHIKTLVAYFRDTQIPLVKKEEANLRRKVFNYQFAQKLDAGPEELANYQLEIDGLKERLSKLRAVRNENLREIRREIRIVVYRAACSSDGETSAFAKSFLENVDKEENLRASDWDSDYHQKRSYTFL